MRIVDVLEVVHIKHQQAGESTLPLRLVQRLLRTQDQEATIGQLDQRVHPAQPLQLAVLRLHPPRQLPAEDAQPDAVDEQERHAEHDGALRTHWLVREAEHPPGDGKAGKQCQRGPHRQADAAGGDLVGHQQCGKQGTGHRAQGHEGDPAAAEQGIGHHAAELRLRRLPGTLGQQQRQRRPGQRIEQQQRPRQRAILPFQNDRGDRDRAQPIADEAHPADPPCRADPLDRDLLRVSQERHCRLRCAIARSTPALAGPMPQV